MRPSFVRQRELLGLAAALAILSAVAVHAYGGADSAEAVLGRVEHTGQVLRQNVSSPYAQAASARRGFVFAADDSRLAELARLDRRLVDAFATLRGSVADNPAQLRRLDDPQRLGRERVARLDAVAERRRAGTSEEAREDLALAAAVRTYLEGVEQRAQRLLSERDGRVRREVLRTKVGVVAETLASFAILVAAFALPRREIGRRRASRSFLDSIVENLPEMSFVKEADELRFDRIDRAGETLLGVSRDDLLGENDYDLFPRDQAAFFHARDRDTVGGHIVVDVPEEPVQTNDGARRLHTKKVPVLDEAGEPRYLLRRSEDITEPRKVAATLNEAMEAANVELETLSYSVAHDLRAPLRAIDGFSRALEEDCGYQLDAERADHLRRVRGCVNQMAQLIDGLLVRSRVSRGEVAREKVDLTAIARQAVTRLFEAHAERRVDAAVHEGPTADGDARLLAACLDSLLGNAWKLTGKKERARIEVGKQVQDGRTVFFDDDAEPDPAYASSCSARCSGSTEPASSRARASVSSRCSASFAGTQDASGPRVPSVEALRSIHALRERSVDGGQSNPIGKGQPGRRGAYSAGAQEAQHPERNRDRPRRRRGARLAVRARVPRAERCVLPALGDAARPQLPKVDDNEVLRTIRADARTRRLSVVILTSSKEERDLVAGCHLGASSYVRKPMDIGEFAEAILQLGLYWLVLNETAPASRS